MNPITYAALEARLLDLIADPAALAGGISEEKFNFNSVALDVHRYQREYNTPYRQFCEFQHTPPPGELTDWRKIPAVPTGAFRHAALRTFPEAETLATFRTSGTTGEGFGSHHFCSLRLYEASILQAWDALGIARLRQVILTQRPADAPHSSLCHMMGVLAARVDEGPLPAQTWCMDAQGHLDFAAFRGAIEAGDPVLLLGTALAFLHLFEQLGHERIVLPPGSIAMETGGYKGTGRSLSKAALYARFGEALGLEPGSILNEYSMTELSSQWYTRGLGNPHTGPGWVRALVVDPLTGREAAEGESGVVRLFDLANLGSVFAVQTQDLAIRRGAGFELLGRAPGAAPRGCSIALDEMLSAS